MTESRVRRGRRVSTALVATAIALVAASCTRDEGTSDTTTTTTTTTAEIPSTSQPATPEAGAGADEPPEPAWIVQIGGPDEDALLAVAARDDEVVATGHTDSALGTSAAVGRDALTATVGTDGELRALHQDSSDRDEAATGVASGSGSTVACGYTTGSLGSASSGAEDAWCAPVGADGALGAQHQQGGTEGDALSGATMAEDGSYGYAAGQTQGIFPGAADTSAGLLGQGDALLWQINPDGTPRWIRQFGTEAADEARAVAVNAEGDGIVVGSTRGSLNGTSAGASDGFVSRYDPTGLPRWSRQFGSEGEESAIAVAVGGETVRGTETFVVAGSTGGALAAVLGGEVSDELDAPRSDGAEPAPGNAGGTDAVIVAFDSTGDEIWTTQLGTSAEDEATAAGVDGSTVLIAGTTGGALATTGDPSAGGSDGFLAALDRDTGALRWITQFGSPASDQVTGLTVSEDGFVVVSGVTAGQMGDQPNAGGSDGFLIAFPLPSAGGSVASAL